jgi:copper chaperone CopZ
LNVIKLFGKKKQRVELVVRGMTCGHCEMRVKKALTGVDGVLNAEASHEREQAVVTVDPKQAVSMEALVAAVQEAGYEAEAPAEG